MTLRIMLVGLVASLGFELPSGSDVSRWAQAGTTWVQARIDDQSGSGIEVKLDLDGPSDCQRAHESFERPSLAVEVKSAPDFAFEAVSETTVADFLADLLADHREESPANEVVPTLVLEEPAPVGSVDCEQMGCLMALEDEAEAVNVESFDMDDSIDAVESMEVSPVPVDRLSSAVRLTREAVQAWAALMQQPVDEAQPSR